MLGFQQYVSFKLSADSIRTHFQQEVHFLLIIKPVGFAAQ